MIFIGIVSWDGYFNCKLAGNDSFIWYRSTTSVCDQAELAPRDHD